MVGSPRGCFAGVGWSKVEAEDEGGTGHFAGLDPPPSPLSGASKQQ